MIRPGDTITNPVTGEVIYARGAGQDVDIGLLDVSRKR